MLPDFYQFFLNTKVIFQPGIRLDFTNELEQLKARKYFLVCDPFFADNGVADEIKKGVVGGGFEIVGIFSDVPPNSEVNIVKSCAKEATSKGAEGIIVLGGGSAMDTAKTANIVLSLGGDLVEDHSGTQTITESLKPLVAIPSTAGTGSEVTSAAVILDEANNTKLSFQDFFIRPNLAVLDPELTLTVPPKVTAMTGMDALTHAIESYTSVQANPMSDALAMKAIKLIKSYLLKAVQEGSDIEARSQMLIASNMAGIAFDHAMVGVVHAMSHATGGIAHVPHGLANSILLPYGMEYNFETSAERYAGIARRFGIETAEMNPEEAARAAIDYIRKLKAEMKQACGLPEALSEAGVKEEQLESISELAVEDGASFFNPREVEAEEVLKKLKEAF